MKRLSLKIGMTGIIIALKELEKDPQEEPKRPPADLKSRRDPSFCQTGICETIRTVNVRVFQSTGS